MKILGLSNKALANFIRFIKISTCFIFSWTYIKGVSSLSGSHLILRFGLKIPQNKEQEAVKQDPWKHRQYIHL